MANLSKYFSEATKNLTCADLMHPNETCVQSAIKNLPNSFLGSAKFFIPFCFSSMVFKIDRWNQKEEWIKFLKDCTKSVLVGFSVLGVGFPLICVQYNIFQKFHLPTLFVVPIMLTSWFHRYLPEKIQYIDGIAMLNIYIEFVIKQLKIPAVKYMRRSRVVATIFFMLFNATIMYGMSRTSKQRFWLLSPNNLKKAEENNTKEKNFRSPLYDSLIPSDFKVCLHQSSTCDKYLITELKKAITFASVLNIIKILLPNITKMIERPSSISEICLKKFDYGLFAFLVGLNGSYTFVQCLLNRFDNSHLDKNSLIAGIISGACYAFCPKYVIFTLGLTATVEMLWKLLELHYKENNQNIPRAMQFITNLPLPHLIFSLSLALVSQTRFLYPYSTSRIAHNFTSILSNKRAEKIGTNFASIMMGFKQT